jgi:hypothetical protein
MSTELIKYGSDNSVSSSLLDTDIRSLGDLSGTFDDIGQLISYLRDLSRQLVPLVDSLVPLADNINDAIENFPEKFSRFMSNNPVYLLACLFGSLFIGSYIGTGIYRNILDIQEHLGKK